MRTITRAFFLTLGTLTLTSCSLRGKDHTRAAGSADNQYLVQGWGENSRLAAQSMLEKYGQPNEKTDSQLIWHSPAPFKRITVYREETPHDFPLPHHDVAEHVVNYPVPPYMASDLASFDGSVSFNRTVGELSVRSNSERMNILALNLATEVVDGKRSWQEARLEHEKQSVEILNGHKTALSEKLLFRSQNNTADVLDHFEGDKAQAQEEAPTSKLKEQNNALRQAQEEEMAE